MAQPTKPLKFCVFNPAIGAEAYGIPKNYRCEAYARGVKKEFSLCLPAGRQARTVNYFSNPRILAILS